MHAACAQYARNKDKNHLIAIKTMAEEYRFKAKK
jgi:hypothetical protein